MTGLRRCSKCRRDKPLEEFHRSVNQSMGRTNQCKACRKLNSVRFKDSNAERFKEWYRGPRADKRAQQREYEMLHPNELRRCSMCGVEKPLMDFSPTEPRCKACNKDRVALLRAQWAPERLQWRRGGPTRACQDCGETKLEEEFLLRPDEQTKSRPIKGSKVHPSRYCAPCRADRKKDKHLRHHYGLSLEEYRAMLEFQGGRCALCRQERSADLCVDHDHVTGKVRGLLCYGCNSMIGQIETRFALVDDAIRYLIKHGSQDDLHTERR